MSSKSPYNSIPGKQSHALLLYASYKPIQRNPRKKQYDNNKKGRRMLRIIKLLFLKIPPVNKTYTKNMDRYRSILRQYKIEEEEGWKELAGDEDEK